MQKEGEQVIADCEPNREEVSQRLEALATNWEELKRLAEERGHKLEESLAYHEFLFSVEEEEAWLNEKITLLSSEDYGDTLAAVQVGIFFSVRFWRFLLIHRFVSDISGLFDLYCAYITI